MRNINKMHFGPKIEYPCLWRFKLIGQDQAKLKHAIREVINTTNFHITFSNSSTRGKYTSLNLEVRVVSEKQRREYYHALRAHDAIRIVL